MYHISSVFQFFNFRIYEEHIYFPNNDKETHKARINNWISNFPGIRIGIGYKINGNTFINLVLTLRTEAMLYADDAGLL